MNFRVKTAFTVSVFALMTGCTSIAEYAADARASYDKGMYEALSKAAMEDAKNHCVSEFQDKTDQVKANPDLVKTCIDNDYQQRLDFYIANANSSSPSRRAASQPVTAHGQKVYRADECVGAVVNGQCHGSIIPKSTNRPTCYGDMINGQCTGPMF